MSAKISGYKTSPAQGRHKALFGEKALVTKLGSVNIVHLDEPDDQTIQQRIQEVIEEEISGNAFEDCCPLCRELRRGIYDVIYDGLDKDF